MKETFNYAVLDTGCAKNNVCGRRWLQHFLESMKISVSEIKSEPSGNNFRFGGGEIFRSNRYMFIPCIIAGKEITIKSDVIDCDISMLISKNAMKRAGMVVNLKNDTVEIFGKIVSLKTTTSGHYCLPVDVPLNLNNLNDILFSCSGLSVNQMAVKLHKQFAHPSAEKLVKLIKKSGCFDGDLIKEVQLISENCKTCLKYKKTPARPTVSLPLAYTFNDTVAMDLKYWDKNYHFLVLVDLATRFCVSCVVCNKRPVTIIEALFGSWISIFGPPRRFLSDNGLEFNNEIMRSLGETFNITVMCTAAESPWSNGVCERLNGVLANNVNKIMTDCKCSLSTALSWAVSARNSLDNNCGYSPNQLVFGQNPSLPGINDKLPALENPSKIKIVYENLRALHKAREEFVKNDSNNRIRRALLHKVRPTNFDSVVSGASVFYKRIGDSAWHGPGIVIGRDGKQILVRHGGTYIRAHMCRVISSGMSDSITSGEEHIDHPVKNSSHEYNVQDENCYQGDEDESGDLESLSEMSPPPGGCVTPTRNSTTLDHATPPTETTVDRSDIVSSRAVSPFIVQRIDSLFRSSAPSVANQLNNNDCVNNEDKSMSNHENVVKHSQSLKNKRIEYECSNNNEIVTGTVINRAGKASGKYSSAYNVKRDDNGEYECVDLKRDVNNWRLIDDSEEVLILLNSDEVFKAKKSEIENWKNNNVYEETVDKGQCTISTRWVVTEKIKDGLNIIKARLVARGFEENTDDINTYSPTCHKETFRLALAIIAANNWKCHSIDIKAAFLQGHEIEREIYLRPPKEFYNGYLWKLKKTVYGLNDAARAWYLRVKTELISLGLSISKLDHALFYYNFNGSLEGIICLHVDDFCYAGSDKFKCEIIDKIKTLFLVESICDDSNFKYIGLNIKQEENNLTLDQIKYISTIKVLNIKGNINKERVVDDNEKRNFRALIGQLNWVATQTRPDILFDVSDLSSKYSNTKVEDCNRADKVLRNILRDNIIIKFSKNLNLNKIFLDGYSDASFANLNGNGSQSGFIIFITDGIVRSPLLWQSHRIKRVVRSTLAAETMALIECVEASIYLAYVINEILWNDKHKIQIRCSVDNKSLVDSLISQKLTDDRHLRINMASLNDLILKEKINIQWIQSADQLANCLTKCGASNKSIIDSLI